MTQLNGTLIKKGSNQKEYAAFYSEDMDKLLSSKQDTLVSG